MDVGLKRTVVEEEGREEDGIAHARDFRVGSAVLRHVRPPLTRVPFTDPLPTTWTRPATLTWRTQLS